MLRPEWFAIEERTSPVFPSGLRVHSIKDNSRPSDPDPDHDQKKQKERSRTLQFISDKRPIVAERPSVWAQATQRVAYRRIVLPQPKSFLHHCQIGVLALDASGHFAVDFAMLGSPPSELGSPAN